MFKRTGFHFTLYSQFDVSEFSISNHGTIKIAIKFADFNQLCHAPTKMQLGKKHLCEFKQKNIQEY